MRNRLQFLHCNRLFSTSDEAKQFIESRIDSAKQFSLYGEPIVLKYGDERNPSILLGIGSKGDGVTPGNANNNIFYIDFATVESDITELKEEINEVVSQLTLEGVDTDTVDLNVEQDVDGTKISADVILADFQIIDGIAKSNIIEETSDGLFSYVGLSYDENTSSLVFEVNGNKTSIELPKEEHVVSGEYVYEGRDAENIILHTNTGNDIKISVEKLIEEWTVETDPNSPIVLSKTHVVDEGGAHAERWQDILKADVRIAPADISPNNILKKTSDNKYLYVDGSARNIAYWKDGQKTNLQDALSEMNSKVSNADNNIIISKSDGVYASVALSYNQAQNKLTLTTSDTNNRTKTTDIDLAGVEILSNAYYDATTEEIVLVFITTGTQTKEVRIKAASLITEWTVNNTSTTVTLNRSRLINGQDQLTANVNVSTNSDNILKVDGDHNLYVMGISSNIKYNETKSVKQALDELNGAVEAETERATERENEIAASVVAEANARIGADEELEYKIDVVSGDVSTLSNIASGAIEKVDELSGKSVFAVESTNTIELEKTGNVIKGVVILDNNSRNIIKKGENGLSSTLTLEYDVSGNTISLIANDDQNTKQTIQLQESSMIESIDYDITTEELVIKYITNGQEVEYRFPIGSILEEWEPYNVNKTVTLERNRITAGKDRLSASVNISDKSDNLITVEHNQTEEVDELYVSSGVIASYVEGVSGSIINHVDTVDDGLSERIGENKAAIDNLDDGMLNLAVTVDSAVTRITGLESRMPEFASTDTVEMTVGNHMTVKSNLKISDYDANNMIVKKNDGVYASAKLTYDPAVNQLRFRTSASDEDTVINLVGAELFENVWYDPAKEAIIIEWKASGGTSQNIEIPVRGILEEWEPADNDDHSVRLTKTRDESIGKDILSADAKILDSPGIDNMLKETSQHYLYVDKAEIGGIISGETGPLQDEINAIELSAGLEPDGTITPYSGETISAATSMKEADEMLSDAISKLYAPRQTASVIMETVEDAPGDNRLRSMIRLSGGKEGASQEDMTITDQYSDEFDDENVLRIIDFTSQTTSVNDPRNGLYLSSKWDCGTFD